MRANRLKWAGDESRIGQYRGMAQTFDLAESESKISQDRMNPED